MKTLKLEIDRGRIFSSFKRFGLDRKVGFVKVSTVLDLYGTLIRGMIKTSDFNPVLKKDINKYTESRLFIKVNAYPKNIKIVADELGYDFNSDRRIIITDKKHTIHRLCRKHNKEYPVGSRCPDCVAEDK